ncbi:MAG TPA: amidohydrolase family protein [Alphaproteobacteria bacterium]|nr:amidohydrolase family protein [Alphaproteobacteria bacterium]
MNRNENALFLKSAHVIDPARGIDRVADVLVVDGKIGAVGHGIEVPADARVINLFGHYLSPGWIDIHVHAIGALGFGDPDSIGIYQGVTSFVDAGGPGIRTLDEFEALTKGRLITDVYAGPYILPMGIVGFDYEPGDDDIRDIAAIPISLWSEWIDAHPGVARYIKAAAYSQRGQVTIEIARNVASALGLPFYLHIGENRTWPELADPFDYALSCVGAGDIITHVYNGCPQGQVLDRAGRILPCVQDAAARGALFDIGFGSYGFSWDVAEKTLAQGLRPHFISSDLQQFNVLRPTFSLSHTMSICLRLGLSLHDVIACVTANPARHLSLSDRAGSLRPGLPADITVFRLEDGRFELEDCVSRTRTADARLVPVLAFKNGRRVECDLARAADERNWFLQIAEDHVPAAAKNLPAHKLAFVEALAADLGDIDWATPEPQRVSVRKALELRAAVERARCAHGLSLAEVLDTIYDCFLDHRLPMQIGLFLVRLDRAFALSRLREVAGLSAMAAAE